MTNICKKGFFSESEALKFEKQLFTFWPKGIDKRWFWLAFQSLEKAGFTYYQTDDEEIMVRERLVCIGLIYYEYCHQCAAHEYSTFNYWNTELIVQLKNDFSVWINDRIYDVQKALLLYLGSSENVTDELWVNCIEGRCNTILPYKQIHVESSEENINKKDGEIWFSKGIDSVNNYISIAL